MGELGADPGQLQDLAAVMRAEGRRIEASMKRVTRYVGGSTWCGRDAERFGGTWARHMGVIRTATDQLHDAADDLERNAADQLRASDHSADPASNPSMPTPAVPGTGPAPSSSMNSTPEDPGLPPLGDPLPRRSESWEIGGALSAGVGASGTARITVMDLPGGQALVRLQDTDAATVSGGASVDLGIDNGVEIELGADADGELAVHTGRSWHVDSQDVPGLLVRLAIGEITGAGMLSPGVPSQSGSGLGFISERITDLVGLRAPEPAVTEQLIGIGTSAGVTAALGIPLLGASGTSSGMIGTRERGGNISLVVGSGAAYSTDTPGGDPSGSRHVEIEIPVDGDYSGHMIVTTTEEIPGGEVLERTIYRYNHDEVAAHLRHAVAAVGLGEITGASGALASLWRAVEPQPIWSDAMGGVVNDDVSTVDVGVALGGDLSGSLTGGRRIVTYRR